MTAEELKRLVRDYSAAIANEAVLLGRSEQSVHPKLDAAERDVDQLRTAIYAAIDDALPTHLVIGMHRTLDGRPTGLCTVTPESRPT